MNHEDGSNSSTKPIDSNVQPKLERNDSLTPVSTRDSTIAVEDPSQRSNDDSDDNNNPTLDSEECPALPYTIWTPRQIWGICITVMFAGLCSPLSSSIYFPVLPLVASDLGVSIKAVNLTVTTFMIFQGVTPMFWANFCDVIGRRPVYLATMILYLAANLGLSFTNVYWLMLVLRCVQSAGSASVVSLGAGTIGDLVPPNKRGGYMSIYNLGTMFGPAIAPVCGGLLGYRFGWHSIFYFLSALAALVLLCLLVFLPETLRSLVGNGSIPARGINLSLFSIWSTKRHAASTAPVDASKLPPKKTWRDVDLLVSIKMFREPDVCFLLLFNSIVYAVFYMVITSISSQFEAIYGLNSAQIGLCFLANGGGMIVGSTINGPMLNRAYAATEKSHATHRFASDQHSSTAVDPNDLSSFPIEEARLRSIPWTVLVFSVATILYGWSLTEKWPLPVPIILNFFIGAMSMCQFNAVTTLLVDLYPSASASATAANNLARCLCGAASVAIVDPMIKGLGAGWTFTLAAGVIVFVTPALWVEYRYGMRFRTRRKERVERKKKKMASEEVAKEKANVAV